MKDWAAGPIDRFHGDGEPEGITEFRITTRQRRSLVNAMVVGCGAGVPSAVLAIELKSAFAGRFAAYFCLAGLMGLVMYPYYGVARTRFGTQGISIRRLTGRREYRWDQISNVSLQAYGRTSRAIILTTTGGRRVRLSVPVSGGIIPDPECPAKFAQIRGAWQDATDRTGPEADTRFIRPSKRILLATGITMQIIAVMVVVGLASSSAFRAHEGWGKLGRFTAILHTCPQPTCTWYGTFVADDYSARNALLGPGGPVITDGQPVTIPAGSTAGQPVTIPADMTGQTVTVPAIDTGAPNIVYPAGGGTAWHAPAEGIAAAGAVFLVVLATEITWLVRARRRHRRART